MAAPVRPVLVVRQFVAVAGTETLRIVRRGETILWFLIAAVLFYLPFVVLGRGQEAFHGLMNLPVRILVESTFGVLRIVEAVGLAAVAWLLASASLGREIERGTLPLLVLGPIRFRTILLGKAAAVLFVIFCLHGFASTALATPLPVLRESIGEWLFRFIGVWLFAASFVADGLADAGLRPAGGRRQLAVRVAGLLRLFVAGRILVLFLRPEVQASGFGLFDLLLHGFEANVRNESIPVTALFVSPRLAAAVALAWLAVSGVAVAAWSFRRAPR